MIPAIKRIIKLLLSVFGILTVLFFLAIYNMFSEKCNLQDIKIDSVYRSSRVEVINDYGVKLKPLNKESEVYCGNEGVYSQENNVLFEKGSKFTLDSIKKKDRRTFEDHHTYFFLILRDLNGDKWFAEHRFIRPFNYCTNYDDRRNEIEGNLNFRFYSRQSDRWEYMFIENFHPADEVAFCGSESKFDSVYTNLDFNRIN